jgi:hypothetical protein
VPVEGLSGDAITSSSNVVTVGKINGTTVPASPASDQAMVTTGTSTGGWAALPNTSTSQFLTYSTLSHTFGSSTAPTMLNAFCLNSLSGTWSANYVLAPAALNSANCSATTTAIEMPMAYACTATAFYVIAGNAGPGDSVTLYKNQNTNVGSTYPHCSIGAGPPIGCSDVSSDHVAFAAGDTWSVRITTSGGSDNTANVRVAFQCQ